MKFVGFIAVVYICSLIHCTHGNGFLKSPTSRSSVWRYFGEAPWGSTLEQNTEDMQLNCGGTYTDGDLSGKCGLCGDPVGGPRLNEAPNGKYATGRPTFVYYEGNVVNVTVQVTARANGGFYKFKICNSDSSTVVSQACFDQYPLKLANTVDQTLIQIPDTDGDVVVPLQLPAGLTCNHCVMQWTWVTARDWRCATMNGQLVCGMGYGVQPTFVNCADFIILPQGTPVPSDFHSPDYNSVYASIHGGHGGHSGQTTTQAPVVTTSTSPLTTTATTTQPIVIVTTSSSPGPSIITVPPTVPTTTASVTGTSTTPASPTTTDRLIIVTPSRASTSSTTPSSQASTPAGSVTTTFPSLTTEKLVPPIVIPPVVPVAPAPVIPLAGGGGGAALGGLSGLLGPLSLGLGGVLAMMAMRGRGEADVFEMPTYSQGILPSPSPVFSAPYVPTYGYTMLPAPVVVPIIEQNPLPTKKYQYQVKQRGFGTSYGKKSGNHNSYGNRGRSYGSNFNSVSRGYGNRYPIYQNRVPYTPHYYGNGYQGQSDGVFFQLPENHAFARFEFDEEPEVIATREIEKVDKSETIDRTTKVTISAYSKDCSISKQTCRSKYEANEPTVYGKVDIVSMICELQCSNNNPNCPAEMCSCSCDDEKSSSGKRTDDTNRGDLAGNKLNSFDKPGTNNPSGLSNQARNRNSVGVLGNQNSRTSSLWNRNQNQRRNMATRNNLSQLRGNQNIFNRRETGRRNPNMGFGRRQWQNRISAEQNANWRG